MDRQEERGWNEEHAGEEEQYRRISSHSGRKSYLRLGSVAAGAPPDQPRPQPYSIDSS
jgi:hypothetical protein